MKAGQRLASVVCDTHVVIVRGADRVTGPLLCGGQPMVGASELSAPSHDREAVDGASFVEGPSVLGKRYTGGDLEVLCVAAGRGALAIDGIEMTLQQPKSLPASD